MNSINITYKMKDFYKGVIVGLLLKDTLSKIVKNIIFNTINTVHNIRSKLTTEIIKDKRLITNSHFICKITNQALFTELFSEENNKIALQPSWELFMEKKVIKIELEREFIDFLNKYIIHNPFSMKFNEFVDLKNSIDENYITLDIPYFQSFGEVYLYINYNTECQKFINVYSGESTICSNDFKITETKIRKNFENILCSSIKITNAKNEYISNYLKLYYNNTNPITPGIIINNYDKINIDYSNIKLILISDTTIKEYSMDFVLNE